MTKNGKNSGIPESNSIRHYIFGLLRTAGNEAVRIPSSYELAERFSVTRRVARYELERLRDEGYLIAKPRIGMFTNPRLNHISATPVQKSMPLIGIINADGTHFLYGIPEARMMGCFHIALAEAGCMLHTIRFSFHDEEMRIRELKNLGLDGILWRVFNSDYPSGEFMRQVLDSGMALAVVSDRIYPGIPQVHLSTEEAEQKLFRHLKKPDRVFQIANTGVITLADALIRKWGLPEKAVRRIGKGKVFQETMEEFRDIIRSEKPDLLFCDTQGNPLEIDWLANYMRLVSKKAGVNVTLYMLRHKFSTDLLKTADLRTVQDLMGHESGAMTLSYARSSDEDRKKAIAGRKMS